MTYSQKSAEDFANVQLTLCVDDFSSTKVLKKLSQLSDEVTGQMKMASKSKCSSPIWNFFKISATDGSKAVCKCGSAISR